MSYILDALKKSEEERKKGDVPGLQTYTPSVQESSNRAPWAMVIVVLVLINGGALVYWSPWDSTNTIQQENVKTAVIQPAPVKTVSSIDQAQPVHSVKPVVTPRIKPIADPIVTTPVMPVTTFPKAATPKAATPKAAILKAAAPRLAAPNIAMPIEQPVLPTISEPDIVPKPVSSPSTAYMPQLSELPSSIQNQIPDLTFSSHMYSSQERFRSITINGKRLKQGKFYDENLYVNEITEAGAILGFDGTLFEVDVLGQWGD